MNARAIKKKRARMKTAVAYLQNYMSTYSGQVGYEDYADETLIDDVLYGLGMALDPENNQYGNGFMRFKGILMEHLAGKPKYLTADQLTEPGYYWWLPEKSPSSDWRSGEWMICPLPEAKSPKPKKGGVFVGPLKAPTKKG